MDDPLKITSLDQPKQTVDYERDTFIIAGLNRAPSRLRGYRTFFSGRIFPSSRRSEYRPGSKTRVSGEEKRPHKKKDLDLLSSYLPFRY